MARRQVIVIGGGASGMLAAGQAARSGAATLLLEKMDRSGRKLLVTGKGRCNLTNVASLPDFIAHFGKNGRFLRQVFSLFFSGDLLRLLEDQGVATTTERGGRVFPAGDDAHGVVEALDRWDRACGVKVRTRCRVSGIVIESGRVRGVEIAPGHAQAKPDTGGFIPGEAVVLATGGASYPSTGSSGDGYRMAKSVGHTIVPIRPALVPLETGGNLAPRLQGLSLRNVRARVWIDGRKQVELFGEMLFTHFGVSGPIVLSLSKQVVDALRAKKHVELSLDLKPALGVGELEARLLREIGRRGKQQFHTLLEGLLPAKLIPLCIDLTGIPRDRIANQISTGERTRLRAWLKDFRLKVTAYRSFDEAIITAGGVDLKEVDARTMASRLIKGLYFSGEVLDLDADTGGYNLQAAFSTGWAAGRAAGQG